MNQSVPNLYQLYALFYDFFDGAYVHHSEWNSKSEVYLRVTVQPNALPTEVVQVLSPAEVYAYDYELIQDAGPSFNPQGSPSGFTPAYPVPSWYPRPPGCR